MLPKYKRILLKLSGESLMGDKSFGFDTSVIAQYALDIKSITELGVQVAIVIGGGNIYCGMNEVETGIERAHGDYMRHAGYRYQWYGFVGWSRAHWRLYPSSKCDQNGTGGRALYPPPRYPSRRKQAWRDYSRCWHW